jgi:hypothetical protein
MKPIRFDLRIGGGRAATLESLREHFTSEIVGHYRSGRLAEWLRSRGLVEQLAAVESLAAGDDTAIFTALCRIIGIKTNNEMIRAALGEPPGSSRSSEKEASLVTVRSLVGLNHDGHIRMPPLGADSAKAAIRQWHKISGDFVEEGEILLSIEMRNSIIGIASPKTGTVSILLCKVGRYVVEGQALCHIA